MDLEVSVCEACRLAEPETEVENGEEPEHPFRVCLACKQRVETYSLRPLEWFNLASIHGPYPYYLHSDFYDDEGVACFRPERVVDGEKYPVPQLTSVAHDPELLVAYSFTKWHLTEAVVEQLTKHDGRVLLSVLRDRVSRSRNLLIESRAYEICAEAVGATAREWIRERWRCYSSPTFFTLVMASARCLPLEESFALATRELETETARDLPSVAMALAWFQSERTLDWIEHHAASPVTNDWGRLASVSQFSWSRAASWLDRGRPLSLVALDALGYCTHVGPGDPLLLKRLRPNLLGAPSASVMRQRLAEYLARDSAPRVRKYVSWLTDEWNGRS